MREIGEAVGLKSPATVKAHLDNLKDAGYLVRDPAKPRAIQVRYEGLSGASAERRPVRHVPLVGDVAAGTDVLASENIEEVVPMPADLTGDGELFMLRVRGESMIDIGIFDGDFVVCQSQTTATKGDIVIAGIPGEEATVKTVPGARRQDRARAPQRIAQRHGVRSGRGADLRQGRHRDAQALIEAGTIRRRW